MKNRIPAMAMSALMIVNLATPAFAAEHRDQGIYIPPIDFGENAGKHENEGGHIEIPDPNSNIMPKPDKPYLPIDPDQPGKPSFPNIPDEPTNPPGPDSNPDGEPEEEVNNSLYYYINLAGDILDTKDSAGHHGASLFTESLTTEYTVNGKNLLTQLRSNSNHVTLDYGYEAIVGEDEDDYESIDAEIRTILSNQGINPTDASILAAIKNQIDNGTNIYDINGDKVSSTLVSTDYYDIFWYILKEGSSHWHVDGVLRVKDIPEVETFNVTYSWGNAPTGVTLPTGATYAKDDTVTVDTTYYTGYEVSANNGKYVFSGWNRSDFTITEDTVIQGTWNFIPTGGLPPTQRAYNVTIKYLLDVDSTELQDPYTATYNQEVTVDVDGNVPATISFNNAVYDLDHITYGTWVSDRYGNYDHVSTAWYTLHSEEPGHITPENPPTEYNYTINYVNKHGTILGTKTGKIGAGEDWFLYDLIPTTSEYGMLLNYSGSVEGENCQEDIIITACYYHMYGLAIKYVDVDSGNSFKLPYNDMYSECSDWDVSDKIPAEIGEYTWVATEGDSVSGTDIHKNLTITAKYQKNPQLFNWEVNYYDMHGNVIDAKRTGVNFEGGGWSLLNLVPASHDILGTLDHYTGPVTGENCQADIVINAYYKANHSVNIYYIDADTNAEISTTYTDTKIDCDNWDYSGCVSNTLQANGNEYTFDSITGDPISGTDLHKDLSITVKYKMVVPTPIPEPTPTPTPTTPTTKKYVYVTVKYVDEDGNQIHDDYTLKIRKNRSYDVNDQILSTIEFNNETYNFINTTGGLLETNCCPNNVTIMAHYVKEVHEESTPVVTPIPSETPNPSESPESTPEPWSEPTQPVETPEIPDVNIPNPTPEVKDEKTEDNDTITDDIPKTGDNSILALAISGLINSVCGLHIMHKKSKRVF